MSSSYLPDSEEGAESPDIKAITSKYSSPSQLIAKYASVKTFKILTLIFVAARTVQTGVICTRIARNKPISKMEVQHFDELTVILATPGLKTPIKSAPSANPAANESASNDFTPIKTQGHAGGNFVPNIPISLSSTSVPET